MIDFEKLTALLAAPSKETIEAGDDVLQDCVDSDYDSDADGNRYDYTTIRSDAPARVFAAMISVAFEQSERTGVCAIWHSSCWSALRCSGR